MGNQSTHRRLTCGPSYAILGRHRRPARRQRLVRTALPEGDAIMPDTRTARVGVHARNDFDFAESDYRLIREARIETLKVLSFTKTEIFERLRRENPLLEV